MNATTDDPARMSPSLAARWLVRRALKGFLGTLDRQTGHPYASLVTVATEPDGRPVLLISKLALHTQNLLADPRASLLIDGTGPSGDPLAGGRVTLVGEVRPTPSPSARARFLARHEGARTYADFPDFAFFELVPRGAHYIGGFGRIVDLNPDELLLPASDWQVLAAAEPEIVAHMNEDHADALRLYATALKGAPEGAWRMTGIDAEGFEIMTENENLRLGFARRITNAASARQELVRMAREARGKV